MTSEQPVIRVKLEFKLEKFDAASGELVEVIEGGDDRLPQVTFKKEEQNGTD